MGLDMYLYAKKFLWHEYDDNHQPIPQPPNALTQDLRDAGINLDIRYVIVEAAYWRKANQVHNWFVQNVQDGEDNCGDYYVSREKLIGLKEICQQVLLVPAMAEELLPSKEGFFFGDVNYDDWYFDQLKNTTKQIDTCLKFPEEWDFEYHSSW